MTVEVRQRLQLDETQNPNGNDIDETLKEIEQNQMDDIEARLEFKQICCHLGLLLFKKWHFVIKVNTYKQ